MANTQPSTSARPDIASQARCLAYHDTHVDIRGEYSDKPDFALSVRIDVNRSIDPDATSIANFHPYYFTLVIDDIVVAFNSYHYMTDAVRQWNTLADIFGYPYVDYDGYTLRVADSPDDQGDSPEPDPAA